MEEVVHSSRRGPTRLSTYAHLGLAVAMIAILVPLVVRASQTPPPTIAEFAPEVTQSIRDAPPAQTSDFGSGDGGGGGGGGPENSAAATSTTTTNPATTTATLQVPPGARVNKCVGSPPRQIEDPQSPPCVPFWDPAEGNGGATSFGVTGDTITVAIPAYITNYAGDYRTMANFFNHRFEFYGRQIQVVPFADSGQNSGAAAMQADAQKVGQMKAFAEMGYPLQDGAETIFYDALARLPNPVISIQGAILSLPASDQAHLASMHPYQWNYVQTPDIISRNLSEMMCKQLANRRPSRAGAPTSLAATRKFGIIRETLPALPTYDPTLLAEGLRSCGQPPVIVEYNGSGNDTASSASSAVTRMNTSGVTSVVCLCHTAQLVQWIMPPAQAQGYFPEWITSNIGDQDGNESLFLSTTPAQTANAIGIRSKNKELPTADTPYVWAIRHESPNNPKPPYHNTINIWNDWVYTNLLLLATGIQMAGPKLTPLTFAQGLQRTRFPNPGCDGPPYYQACVGFPGGSHSMQQSFAQIRWDPNKRNPGLATGSQGAYCYVNEGRRRSLATWTGPDAYENSPCE